MTVSRSHTLTIAADPVTVFNTIVATPQIGKAIIQYWDPATWRINAACSLSFNSWGEDVVLQIFYGPHSVSVITVESHTILPTALVDFGKNEENVRSICNDLAQRFPGGVFEMNP